MNLQGSPVSPNVAPLDAPESLKLLDHQSLDRQELEQKLRDTERHFQSWFEDAPVACHEVDRQGVLLCVNQAECELLGFSAQEMIGRPIWDFMAPEDREKTRTGLLQRIADEQPLVPLEREYKRREAGESGAHGTGERAASTKGAAWGCVSGDGACGDRAGSAGGARIYSFGAAQYGLGAADRRQP